MITIEKFSRRRAQPEIVHKDSCRLAAAQKSKSKFQCAEVLRSVNQNDVARLDQLRHQEKRIAEATIDIPGFTQPFCSDLHIG